MPYPRHEQPFTHFDLVLINPRHHTVVTPQPLTCPHAVEPASRHQQCLMRRPSRQATDHFQLCQRHAGQPGASHSCRPWRKGVDHRDWRGGLGRHTRERIGCRYGRGGLKGISPQLQTQKPGLPLDCGQCHVTAAQQACLAQPVAQPLPQVHVTPHHPHLQRYFLIACLLLGFLHVEPLDQ
ncbi:hypothetical protein D3C76_1167930 [compost metagenome]